MLRIKILLLLLLAAVTCQAQNALFRAMLASRNNNLLLDYVTAKAAYSVRPLKKGVTKMIRVRKSTDNTEYDIGASGAELDTAYMKSVIGTASAYIVAMYNQAADSMHLMQTTASLQPRIMNAGIIERENARIRPVWTAQWMSVASSTRFFKFLHDGTTSAVVSVIKFGTASNPNAAYAWFSNAQSGTDIGIWNYFDDRVSVNRNNALAGNIRRGDATTLASQIDYSDAVLPNTLSVVTAFLDADNATAANRMYYQVDNGALLKQTAGTADPSAGDATTDMYIGRLSQGSNPFSGSIQEIIFFNTDISAKTTIIYNNINDHYALY